MQRYMLTIEYDGTDFSGWQIQPNDKTVEQTLEDAFSKVLQRPINLIGQGRTDAGVHARGQVAHVDVPKEVNMEKTLLGVNGLAGQEIQVVGFKPVSKEFHARFDATGREYEYTMIQRNTPLLRHHAWMLRQPVDTQILQALADEIHGEYDFSGFSKYNKDNYTTLCTIQKSNFEIEGEIIRYRIRANRFLRNMVRRLVGTMARVAQGKMEKEEFMKALNEPNSKIPTYTAPGHGLVLQKVFYKK